MVFNMALDYGPINMTAHASSNQPHASAEPGTNTTHFGFRTVADGEKSGLVRAVFDAVAPKYDLMNDLMSAGIHRLWKAALIDWLAPRPGQAIIDVAGGTGDIAFRLLDRTAQRVPVTICDINAEMLSVGRNRA